MQRFLAGSIALGALLVLSGVQFSLGAQTSSASPSAVPAESTAELKFVVVVSRHGVRSPTGKPGQFDQYSANPWPKWEVNAGYLTEHGAKLMKLFGAYDREMLANEGLFGADGCAGAENVSIVADSDQRTRETGKALAAGLFPGCMIDVHALAEGTPDPLFHPLESGVGRADKALATAAVAGRIGNDPAGLTEAYRLQLDAMQEVLLGCKPGPGCVGAKALLSDAPAFISQGKGDHPVELAGPLNTAGTMSENLLLEYTEGFDKAQVGWGRVDGEKLRELIQLHAASVDVVQHTPYIARAQSSNLLSHMLDSMKQAITAEPVPRALGKPGDRLLVLVGHDTNLENISSALELSWLIDGRRDDTPPGGALVFEVWKSRATGEYLVRTSYMAQTLEQMRNTTQLSLEQPPQRVTVFVPGCQTGSWCTWKAFQQTVQAATDANFVK